MWDVIVELLCNRPLCDLGLHLTWYVATHCSVEMAKGTVRVLALLSFSERGVTYGHMFKWIGVVHQQEQRFIWNNCELKRIPLLCLSNWWWISWVWQHTAEACCHQTKPVKLAKDIACSSKAPPRHRSFCSRPFCWNDLYWICGLFWCTKLAPPSQSPPVGEGDQIACSTTGSPLRGERVKLLAPPPPGRGSPPHGDPVVEQTCFLVGNN